MISFTISLLLLINSERATPLKIDPLLTQRAQERAELLCEKKQWSHDNWLDSFRGMKGAAGENLAINFTDPVALNKALMNSPTHKSNIIKKEYKYIGIGQACHFTVELFKS